MSYCFSHFRTKKKQHQASSTTPLNVLLTNGRFPVSLDLARQLYLAGHNVFIVDPMEYHICKFSIVVKHSYYSPAPNGDREGYVKCVKEAIRKSKIDLIIPLHEEIFYLAECDDKEILERLFAPKFDILYRLHNKWTFSNLLDELDLDIPEAHLCRNMDDIRALNKSKEWAVKPILGRAATGVHHLKSNQEDLPEIDISEEKPHIAQEWLYGNRYCTYGIFRQGDMQAFVVYPVLETIDGSSSVYFQAVDHEGIKEYVRHIAESIQATGQLAFDFIETGVPDPPHRHLYAALGMTKKPRKGSGSSSETNDSLRDGEQEGRNAVPRRLVSIECNPRATSGIHLWSRSPSLADVFSTGIPSPYSNQELNVNTTLPMEELKARPNFKRQVMPGMLMWEHKNANFKRFMKHMLRLMKTRDVVWSWSDMVPVLVQPFLLMSYYEICREKGGMSLPDMFQDDLIWEPNDAKLIKQLWSPESFGAEQEGGGQHNEEVDASEDIAR